MTLWLAIAGMAVLTFFQRACFLLLPERVRLPQLLRRSLRYVPAAVLTAIWVPELLLQKGVMDVSLHDQRLFAGVIAAIAAWRFRMTFVTIATGLIALHALDYFL